MRKIATTTELQAELRSLLAYTKSKRPSRLRLAAALQDLSVRVARTNPSAPPGWTEKNGVWLSRAQYADGTKHTWGIYKAGDKFGVEVDTSAGTYQRKKPFDDLDKAQKYAGRFISKAHGASLLADVLDKDFKPVNGRKHVSPLNLQVAASRPALRGMK